MERSLFAVLFLLSLLSAAVFPARAQTVFAGQVQDGNKTLLPGANVVAYSAEGRILSYSITDGKGRFSLNMPPGTDHVAVSHIGFKTVTVPRKDIAGNRTVTLEEGSFSLKEVAVTAQRIQENGDTLTYSVAGFRQAQDRSIADVIGKMPGLEVKEDGSIEYQGKPISDFYVEGLDLTGSRYALASSNIPADKVKSVQVLENHQKIKSLRGLSFTEQAALNLVLKEDAKSAWTGLADIGSGFAEKEGGFLYDNRLMGMRFGRRFQSLLLYKNNDTGSDIGHEVQDLLSLKGYIPEEGPIGMMSLGGPDFSAERYTFNASHLLAGNWLWKTGRNAELRVQADAFGDRERQRSANALTYLVVDGMPVVTEDWNVLGKRNEVKGEVDYMLNADRTCLKSNTRVYSDWNSSTGTMRLGDRGFELMVKPCRRVICEDLDFFHATEQGSVWQFNSSTGNTHLPGRLLTINGSVQSLDLELFSTKNAVNYRKRLGRYSLKTAFGFDARRQKMNGKVWSMVRPYWEPSFQMIFGSHRLTGAVGASYVRQSYERQASDHFHLEPALNWNWKPDAKSEFILSCRLSARPLEGTDLVDVPVYTSFRQQFVGNGTPGVQFLQTFSGSYTYRNPVTGVFLNIRPMYIRTDGNVLYEHTLVSDVYVRMATDEKYSTGTYRLGGRWSKTFLRAHAVAGLDGVLSSSESGYLAKGSLMRTRVNTCRVSADCSLRPAPWLSAEGRSGIVVNCRTNLGDRSAPAGRTADWTHELKLHLMPAGGWMFSVNNELYHSSEKDFGMNWFCDLSLGYKARRWELSLLVDNVIGISEYRRIRVSSAMQSCTLTCLRPRDCLIRFSVDL